MSSKIKTFISKLIFEYLKIPIMMFKKSRLIKLFLVICIKMGWSTGAQQIMHFANAAGATINIIDQYGQIDSATLSTACQAFCSARGAQFQQRARQNNTMMANASSQRSPQLREFDSCHFARSTKSTTSSLHPCFTRR